MQLGSPLVALHNSLALATHRDMPEVEYTVRDWTAYNLLTADEKREATVNKNWPTMASKRRPDQDQLEVVMFPQSWGSTALGYGGMGGSAITPAYTVIVSYQYGIHCVYFGGRELAYMVDFSKCSKTGIENFREDQRSQCMASKADSVKYL